MTDKIINTPVNIDSPVELRRVLQNIIDEFNKVAQAGYLTDIVLSDDSITTNMIVDGAVTNAKLATPPVTPVFTEEFISADQTVTSAGSLTIPHGLSAAPKLVAAFLVCTTANLNYSIGDVVPVAPHGISVGGNDGHSITFDATDINVRFGSSLHVYDLLNKTTGVWSATILGRWELRIKAWL